MKKIIRNRIKCKKCGEIIESTSRHDFKFCKCGAVAVDGGKDYLRRVGSKEDYEELVEYEGSQYVLATELVESVAKACGWDMDGVKTVGIAAGKQLERIKPAIRSTTASLC